MSSDWAVIPALNDFHPIHKFHVFVFGLGLGHDHCNRWCVKLKEEKTKFSSSHHTNTSCCYLTSLYWNKCHLDNSFLQDGILPKLHTSSLFCDGTPTLIVHLHVLQEVRKWMKYSIIILPLLVVFQLGLSSATSRPRCTPHRSLPHTAW